MKYMKYVMKKIDAFRKQRGLTAGEMATVMGICRDSYYQWTRDPSMVRIGAVDKACSFLKVDASMIMNDNDPLVIDYIK